MEDAKKGIQIRRMTDKDGQWLTGKDKSKNKGTDGDGLSYNVNLQHLKRT